MWINLDDFLIVTDYASQEGKSITWINKLIKDGKLPYIEHNGRKLIPKDGKLPGYIKEQNENADDTFDFHDLWKW